VNGQSKRIGITLRIVCAETYFEKRDALSHEWPPLVEQLGGQPILIPNRLRDVHGFLDAVRPEGLILSGGDNYGDDADRDRTEREVFSYGVKNRIPTIGVCRGMQVINLLLGGGMQRNSGAEHVNKDHGVSIVDEAFAPMLGNALTVNSYHAHTILPGDLAARLKTFAACSDGTVEGFSHAALPIAGVMWHPERNPNPAGVLLLRTIFDRGGFWIK
jgi:putative glutamine amidotransferase